MAIDDNPITVFNKQLDCDELSKPIGAGVISQAAKAANVLTQLPPLRPFGLIAKSLDLAAKCLALGVPTVEENLRLLGRLTEDAILRAEESLSALERNAENVEKFQRRVESKEFMHYLASGVLQTQRTTQQNRLKRMAWIIANGVKEGDLDPESGDDMMRAAAELKDADIVLLGQIYGSQAALLRQQRFNSGNWFGDVQSYWNEFVNSGALDASKHLVYRSSFSRLESHGLIQKFREISTAGVGLEPYVLLEEGKKFYERLQEIATQQ